MDIFVTLSILGSIASIIGLLLPASSWKTRSVHVIYGLVMVALSYSLIETRSVSKEQELRLVRIENIERSANLISESKNRYTSLGYAQAVLAFLEKNKDIYPDTYERAKEMCEQSKCLNISQELDHAFGMNDLSSAFSGLLTGISVLSADEYQR